MYEITVDERKRITDGMIKLFEEYGYDYSDSAIDKIIDTWEKNKNGLIEAFQKHPNYVEGKFLIAFDKEFSRCSDPTVIDNFRHWIMEIVAPKMRNTLPYEINERRVKYGCSYLPDKVWNLFWKTPIFNRQFLTDEQAQKINEALPNIKARVGTKTSRVVNKICEYLGYSKHPDYNREFAKFADALNPLHITRHTVLSINPLDYLTMSFGNSWASCHTIDKHNARGMDNSYSGCYSSGTVSYMLDKVSIVMYTVDAKYDGTDYYFEDKITRQMFHYGKEKLIQGRLYPQSNDEDTSTYSPYRQIMQEAIANCFGFPNLWDVKKGTEACARYVLSEGTHYKDYLHFSACNISRIKDSKNTEVITIGHDPICIECGDEHYNEECINCCSDPDEEEELCCPRCGCTIDRDEAIEWGDEYYCTDCVCICERCGEPEYRDNLTWIDSENRYVCEDCLDYHYRKCDDCDEWFNERNMVCDDDGNWRCEECQETWEEEQENENEGDAENEN